MVATQEEPNVRERIKPEPGSSKGLRLFCYHPFRAGAWQHTFPGPLVTMSWGAGLALVSELVLPLFVARPRSYA